MHNILNLFTGNTSRNFIRVIIFDEFLKLHHIKSGVIFHKLCVDLSNNHEIFQYLQNHQMFPVEIIIGSKSMCCKSVLAKKITSKDIFSLARNTLSYKKDIINTILYTKKKLMNSNRDHISFCEVNINEFVSHIIHSLFAIKNVIRCVTAWPIWIISSYFGRFLEDEQKFGCSLFVLENEDSWEIIGYNNGLIVCYRSGSVNFFDKQVEVENTIKYIVQTYKISSENIAIYVINEQVIDEFVNYSNQNMSILSKVIDNKSLPITYNISKIANLGFSAICTIFLVLIGADFFKLHSIKHEIKEANKVLNSIDKNILSEISLWKEVNFNNIKQPDFKSELRNYIKNNGNKILQMALLKVTKDGNKIEINTKCEDF